MHIGKKQMSAKNLKTSLPRPRPSAIKKNSGIKVKVIVHEAEEGGFWAEVPALPGCFTQGENRAELLVNLRDAVEGCLRAGSGLTPAQEGREEEIEL
jgi:predicted RNase H-like HicB family nuclease